MKILIINICFMLCCFFSQGQDSRKYFYGFVKDKITGQPLTADINIYDDSTSNIIQTVTSDSINGYQFNIINSKKITITIRKEKYFFYSEFIDLQQKNNGDSIYKTFELNIIKTSTDGGRLESIFYDKYITELKHNDSLLIVRISELMNKYPEINLIINGHCDFKEAKSKIRIDEKRAVTVQEYLEKIGINSSRISYKGYLDTQPIAVPKIKDGDKFNRRVDFVVIKNKSNN